MLYYKRIEAKPLIQSLLYLKFQGRKLREGSGQAKNTAECPFGACCNSVINFHSSHFFADFPDNAHRIKAQLCTGRFPGGDHDIS